MRITAVRLRRQRGTLSVQGRFWEERLVRPVDVYPECRVRDDPEGLPQTAPDGLPVEAFFVPITIPHGRSAPAGVHFSATRSPIHTPYQECLVKWNAIHQHFLAPPVRPVQGRSTRRTSPASGWSWIPLRSRRKRKRSPDRPGQPPKDQAPFCGA